ncbi:hypothetical protein LZZ85_22115 [Terrimonas sp. NA20]|uniref:Peptidase M1 membrane alanine aminopeptidase domain-containing protein n=1 Tax=Terrimonas ginsenosidimutans TaxID=2908004 RepID=A0ABS9KXD7_9BACT|nr:M1 family aminopeptidase [Terrimonas ginsenosidimutans]MCG2617007.1 hypothetical protein [Terrimonas ginsenosidimutans]
MLNRLLRFELKYHSSQTVFRIALLIFFLLGMIAVRGGFGNDVYKNSPYVIMNITGLLSLCTIFSGTLFCANVILRDKTYRMDSMLFTTSIRKRSYFITRFTGLFLAVLMSLVCTSLGMIAGCFLLPSSEVGTFHLLHYVYAIITIGAPNVLLCCAILFSAAVLSSSIRLVYASGVLLYVFYWAGSMLGNSPLLANADPLNAPGSMALIADPFGLSIFFSETKNWTAQQRNSLLMMPEGLFLVNRLAWTTLSLLVLALTFRSFRFELKLQETKKIKEKKIALSALTAYRPVNTSATGFSYVLKAFRSQFRLETAALFKHIPFMVMMIVWVFMYAVELKDTLFGGIYSIRSYPDTSVIIEQFVVIRPVLVLIIFYAAELTWRERSANMHSLIYSSPLRNIIPWAAKLACLAVLIAFVITANIGIGIAIQVMSGYSQIDFTAYLQLYYYCGIPLLLFSVLILFIITLCSNKYLGIMLAALVTATIVFSARLGIEHYMLRYASVPELFYTAMNGFGRNATSFNWYMLYWGCFALLLSAISIGLWQNTRATGFKQRLLQLRKQFTLKALLLPAASIAVMIVAGGWIYHQTNTTGGYKSRGAKLQWQIDYEKKYRAKALTIQPFITSVKTEVDIFPADLRYTVRGTYQLKNGSAVPLASLWLGIDPSVTSADIAIAGAKLLTHDAVFGQYEYALSTPLKPGDRISILFSLEITRSGFTSFDAENNVAPDGTYIELEKFLPYIGYNDRYETDDKVSRLANHLPEKPSLLPPDTLYHLVDYETTISSEKGQSVVSVGSLKETWEKNGRSFFRYRSEQPIPFMFALSSAAYKVRSEIYDNVRIELYYHPGHEANTTAMLLGMKDALDYCRKNFGDYPFSSLKMAEVPQYGGAATAYPGVMFNAERINYLSDYRDTSKVNHAYAIAAHETAHQWWGTKLQPSAEPGSKVLTESLAKYTENMVVQKRFGRSYLRNYLENDSRLYFIYREFAEEEHTMDTVINQPFVYYQKGGIGLYAIQESIGEQQMSEKLKSFLMKHSSTGIRANTAGLKQALTIGASENENNLITDLFSKRITWNLSVDRATIRPLQDGQFEIECTVSARKMDGSFRSTREIPISDSIDIAVFGNIPGRRPSVAEPVYINKFFLNGNSNKFRWVMNAKPATICVDPYSVMLESDRADNTKAFQQE